MGQKIQHLQHKLGHYRSRVSNRVASTIRVIRTRSSSAYGFKTSIGGDVGVEEVDPADARARQLQLHNTIVRALLVDEVLYEPSRLLKKSRRAVAVITGADLAIVKMTKTATTAAEAADAARASSTGGTEGSSDGGAADDAQATVLAQHELNKMVRCEVKGNRLELEFIVTSSARFKVSAAALGLSSSSGGVDAAAPFSSAKSVQASKFDTGSSGAAIADQQQEERKESRQDTPPISRVHSPTAGLEGCSAAASTSVAQAAESPGRAFLQDEQQQHLMHSVARDSTVNRHASHDPADSAAAHSLQYGSTPPTAGSSSNSFQAWSTPHRSSAGTGVPQSRSGSYVRQLGSSMVQGASRSVSSSISNFRLVKTDDVDYWVCVESFTLWFRDATMCELAASLLLSGRSSMRVALEWLKQGLPFTPEFAITHITELSSSRMGNEVLVAGPTPWGTELQLPDSWTDAIRAAPLPEEHPLMTALEVPDGPAAFKIHLATPAGLAEATLLPEMLALLAHQANPQHTGQLLAVPVSLRLIPDSMQASQPEPPTHKFQSGAASAAQQDEVAQQQQQQQQQCSAPTVAVGRSKYGSSSSSNTGGGNSGSSHSHSIDAQLQPCGCVDDGDADYFVEAEDAGVGIEGDEDFTEGDTEEALELEQAVDVTDAAADDSSMSAYDSCAAVGLTYQRSISNNSTRGILKNTQHVDSTPVRDGGVDAVDNHMMPAAVCSPQLRVGWSSDVDGYDHPLQAHSNGKQTYSINMNAVQGSGPQQQQAHLHGQPQQQLLQQHQQHQQLQQRTGLHSKAKRAAKKLLRRVVTPRRLGLKAEDTTLSGPPDAQGSNPVYRRSKSNPDGLLAAAAAVSANQSGCESSSSAAGGSVQVHRFGSSGELLPVHVGGVQLAEAAAHDAQAATVTVQIADTAYSSTQQSAEFQPQQPQQQLRQVSAGRAVLNSSADAFDDNSAVLNSEVLISSTSSRDLRLKPEDQEEIKLSFLSEMYAVIHVQLVPCHSSSTGNTDNGAGSMHTESTAASAHATLGTGLESPFASAAAMPGPVGEAAATNTGAAPSVLVLGDHSSTHRTHLAVREQQLLSALGLLAGLLCGLGLLAPHTIAGRLLILMAALLNAMCIIGSAHPTLVKAAAWRIKCGSNKIRTATSLVASTSIHAHMPAVYTAAGTGLTTQSSWASSAFHSLQAEAGRTGAAQPQQQPGSANGAGTAADIGAALQEGRLRLRLLGGGFMKEALGMLEEQILAYKTMRERAAAAAEDLSVAIETAGSDDASGLAAAQHSVMTCESTDAVVLISNPEPEWMTPDWRRRIIVARPNDEERRKVANTVHVFRMTYAAGQMLKRPPPHFEFFHENLGLKPLLVTPQGYVVLLLKMHSLVQMSRTVAATGLTINDLVVHCGFLWSFMFEVLAPQRYPAGRTIMVADMSNIKLGQAVGEGQIGARALGEVCFAWPERLGRCLVLGTPSWFNMLYRMVRPHLSPTTRAKVQVCNSSEGAAELARCLGPELVPKEFGGPCTLNYDEYPAQKQLMQFVAKLRLAQQQEPLESRAHSVQSGL